MKNKIIKSLIGVLTVSTLFGGYFASAEVIKSNTSTDTPEVQIKENVTSDYEESVKSSGYAGIAVIKSGESYKITNTGSKTITILDDNDRDINVDAVGYTQDLKASNLDIMNKNRLSKSIKPNGFIIVTNNGDNNVNLVIADEYKDSVSTEKSSEPALCKYQLKAGNKYEIKNNSDTSINIDYKEDEKYFDYVMYGNNNDVWKAVIAENISVPLLFKDYTARLYAESDIVVGIPYLLKDKIDVNITDKGVFTKYILKAGETYKIAAQDDTVKSIALAKHSSDKLKYEDDKNSDSLEDKTSVTISAYFGADISVKLTNEESKDVEIFIPSDLDNKVIIESENGKSASSETTTGKNPVQDNLSPINLSDNNGDSSNQYDEGSDNSDDLNENPKDTFDNTNYIKILGMMFAVPCVIYGAKRKK